MNSSEVYKAPNSDLFKQDLVQTAYYTVAKHKLITLIISTMGLYVIYWFYKNWKYQEPKMDMPIRPFWRGLFYYFYVHSLFARVYGSAKNQQIEVKYNLKTLATVLMIAAICGVISSGVSNYSTSYLLSMLGLLSLPATLYPLLKTQEVINQVNNDPKGEANCRYTALNIIFIVIGVIWWLLTLFGLYVIATIKPVL